MVSTQNVLAGRAVDARAPSHGASRGCRNARGRGPDSGITACRRRDYGGHRTGRGTMSGSSAQRHRCREWRFIDAPLLTPDRDAATIETIPSFRRPDATTPPCSWRSWLTWSKTASRSRRSESRSSLLERLHLADVEGRDQVDIMRQPRLSLEARRDRPGDHVVDAAASRASMTRFTRLGCDTE